MQELNDKDDSAPINAAGVAGKNNKRKESQVDDSNNCRLILRRKFYISVLLNVLLVAIFVMFSITLHRCKTEMIKANQIGISESLTCYLCQASENNEDTKSQLPHDSDCWRRSRTTVVCPEGHSCSTLYRYSNFDGTKIQTIERNCSDKAKLSGCTFKPSMATLTITCFCNQSLCNPLQEIL